MNKKAVTTAGIVVIILGLLVILLVVTGPLRVGYEYAKEKFFGERGIFAYLRPTGEERFQPYVAPEIFLEEEKIIDNSIKAFVCAVNSLALREPAWLKPKGCPEGFVLDNSGCDGASYGKSCVKCYEEKEGLKTLPLPVNKEEALNLMVKEAVDCWKKHRQKKESVYCAKFNINPLEPRAVIGEDDFKNKLKSSDEAIKTHFIEETIAKTYYYYKWKISTELIHVGTSNFYMCTKKGYPSKVYITSDLSDCGVDKSKIKKGKEYKCNVENFELPQEVDRGIPIIDFALGWIKKYNDPEYLVYYESFPRGEDSTWHIDEGSFFIDVVVFGAGLNAFGALGFHGLRALKGLYMPAKFNKEAAENALKYFAGKAGTRLSPRALAELAEFFTKEGYEQLLRSEQLYSILLKNFPDLSEGTVRQIGRVASKSYSRAVKEGVEDTDELFRLIKNDVFDSFPETKIWRIQEADGVLRSIREFVEHPPTSRQLASLERQQKIRQFFNKYLFDQAGNLNKNTMETLFSRGVSQELLEELDETAVQQFMFRTAQYADEMVDIGKAGLDIVKPRSMLGPFKGELVGSVKKEFNTIADEILEIPHNKASWQYFLTGITREEVEAVSKKGYVMSAKDIASRYNPLTIKYKDTILPIPRIAILRSIGASGVNVPVKGAVFASDAAKRVWKSRAARYSAALIIASVIAKADAANERYASRGGNSVVLQKPYYYDLNKVYDLGDDTSNFYLNLFKYDKEKKGSSRFYLASPCKADLTLTRTKCSCMIDSGDYMLHFTRQPILPEFINYTDKNYYNQVFMFDEYPEFKSREFPGTKAAFHKEIIEDCISGGGRKGSDGFADKCAITAFKNPEAYDKFVNYVYDRIYIPAWNFMTKYNFKQERSSFVDSVDYWHNQFRIRNSAWIADANYPAFRVVAYFTSPEILLYDFAVARYFDTVLMDSTGQLKANYLKFDDFKRAFEAELVKEADSKNPVKEIYEAIYAVGRRDELINYNSFLGIAAKNTFLNYYYVDEDKIDMSKIVKVCEHAIADKSSGTVIDDYMTRRVVIDCFNAEASLDRKYNNANNYCFAADTSYITTAKWIFTGTAIAIDVIVGLIPGVNIFAEVPVALVTGGLAAWAGYKLDKTQWWPQHPH